jgi:ubiquinone/menaquinone biosynthesis C-methylase UbiE
MKKEVHAKMYERGDGFWWYVGMARIAQALLDVYFKKDEKNKILDIGCGSGGMFKMLSAYGAVYGIDISPDAIGYARLRNIAHEIKEAGVENLPFPDGYFNAVSCFDVLYHQWVNSLTNALREIHRVLKPGGLLIIREASYNWLQSQHDQLFWTKHRFYKKELVADLQAAGFIVKKNSYVNFFLFPLALAERAFRTIWPTKDSVERLFIRPPLLNGLFSFLLFLEARMLKYFSFPFGLSIVCVAEKQK